MKQILKIGITIVGVILLYQSFSDIENLITTILSHIEGVKVYSQSKGNLTLGFSLFILLLKIVSGLVLVIKPSILSNVYFPEKVEALDNTSYKLVITFIFCFGIYLMITGAINTINLAISRVQFLDGLKESAYYKYWWLDFIKHGVKIAIGYSLYKRFLEEIYKTKTE